MEPWLDSLSEDWDSQPRSSPPASLPKSTPNGSMRSVTRPPQSKIPRPRSSSKPHNSSSPLGGQSASLKRKKILTERSSSEVNASRHPSTRPTEAKIPSSLRLSRSSSAGSVVRKSSPLTTQRKSRSASPRKQDKSQTPEWKRLVMGDGKGATPKSDLFTPIGLESIFVKPAEEPAPPSPEIQHESSTLHDSENIPSSPPPLPSNYLASHIRSTSNKRWDSYQTLEVVVEQDETGSERVPEDQIEESEQTEPPPARYGSGKQGGELTDIQASHNTPDRLQRPLVDSLHHKIPSSSDVGQVKSDPSVSSSLSAVYISKYNTLGGGINYAALDMSNPETMMQLKQASLYEGSQNRSSSWRTAIKDEPTNIMQCATPERQIDVAPISGFVSVERGGYSDDDSFKRRPLSPSMPLSDLPSESLAPSDSASQIAPHSKRGGRESGFEQGNESEMTDTRQTLEPGTVRATVANHYGLDSPDIHKSELPSSPLKLFGDHDTFTNNQLLRRIGQLDISGLETIAAQLTCRMRDRGSKVTKEQVYREILKSAQQPSDVAEDASDGSTTENVDNSLSCGVRGEECRTSDMKEDTMYSQDPEPALSKRSPPTPIDQSFPKRQRTISRLDAIPDTLQEQSTEDQNRLASSLIGKKRKDARNGGNRQICGPDELAKRPILRPRQSSSAGYQIASTHPDITSGSFVEGESRLDTIQRHMEDIDFSVSRDNDVDIEQLVSGITNSPANLHLGSNGDIRKQSYSTQDYLAEATKLMEVLRSRRKPESEFSNFQQSIAEDMTPQTISRPPSREGPMMAWRDQNREPLAESVLDHLKQFAEIGEESFAVSSAIKSFHLKEDEISGDEDRDSFESERHDVRILDQHLIENEDLDQQRSETWKEDLEHQQTKTNSSQGSTNSTGRTFKTNSSQKTRNVATIPPDKVSHLIQTEQAGMRFDTEKRTWVRCKTERSLNKLLENISSSTGTEDDPFGDIPDLDVDEIGESNPSHFFDTRRDSSSHTNDCSHQVGNLSDEVSLSTKEDPPKEDLDGSDYDDHRIASLRSIENKTVINDEEQLLHEQSESICEDDNGRIELSSHTPINTPPVPSARKPSLMIRPSMNFSPLRCLSNDLESSQMSLQPYHNWFSDFNGDIGKRRHTTPVKITCTSDNYEQQMALSCIDEHREISFIETRPDGRSFSLTLSMSTPMPSSDRRVSFARSNTLRNGGRFLSLSPLSEFTIHQDDHRHLQSRNLLGRGNAIQVQGNHAQSSTTVSRLVDKLMEAHPEDETDWDMTKSLTLHEKSLDSLLMLDEFCPKLEYLDASWNDLRHIEGIPSMVRQLDVRQNLLSSLTDWFHLKNLQYLDVSGNDIDSLEALNCLVHLRELNADDNCIMDFQGLLDLDGLLHLSMRRNELQYVGLHGANMWRLAKLDLRDNSIEEVDGLSSLPCLEELYLSNNSLEHFAGPEDVHEKTSMKLHSLWVDSNKLAELDVSAFSKLRVLVADNNSLPCVKGIRSLNDIDTVSLRSQGQVQKGNGLAIHFDDFAEVRHLFVSDNDIPVLDMTSSFLNLQTLEIALTGLKHFPKNFGMLAPNLRILNANSNSLRDLYPLNGIQRLKTLLVAGNRIRRLRDTALRINQISELQELDLRGNPFCARFYALMGSNLTADRSLARVQCESPQDTTPTKGAGLQDLQHVLPRADKKQDKNCTKKLEDDARFRRKVYELLLATRCHNLATLDGLDFEFSQVLRRDSVWRHLTNSGCIEKSMVAVVE